MSEELVSVTINDITVLVPKGTMVIEAAKRAGILVPHYCYHPSLPSPALCRMCLVEIEKAPKLAPACVTAVAEGQVVHVHAPAAVDARSAVLEFLLINHPLDCPICDQSGECELQDFTFQEGQPATRYSDYGKRYAPVEDFGRDILYVPNRCILCTRCVRFMDSVVGETILDVYQRGDRSYIGIDPDVPLDHPWSGNVVDLCPVGSLLSKDFLHKARAWELDKTASICPGCSQGCNMTVDVRDDAVVRLRPRPNLEVNRHFMCDIGREDYRWMNRGDRVEAPLRREAGRLHACDWDAALSRLDALVRQAAAPEDEGAEVAGGGEGGARGGAGEIVVLIGRRASCEAIGWTMQLAGTGAHAAMQVPLGNEVPIGCIPGLALRSERAPNVEGARMLGVTGDWQDALRQARQASLVILLDPELSDDEFATLGTTPLVVLATVPDARWAHAELVLPVTTMVEEQGVYVNRERRAQRYLPARPVPGMARPGWWVMAQAWARQRDDRQAPTTASEALGRLAPFGGLDYRALGLSGLVVPSVPDRAVR